MKDALLLLDGEPRVERQDFRLLARGIARQRPAAERLGRFVDIAFRGHEDEHVAAIDTGHLLDGRPDRILQIRLVALLVRLHGPPEHIDRIGPPRDLDHRRGAGYPLAGLRGEMLGKTRRVDRRRGDDQPQFGPLGEQPFQVADEEIDVQRALVGLVEDDRVILVEVRVALRLGQQDAVGHQLNEALRPDRLGEADLVAHVATQGRADLLGDPRGHTPRGDPPRLRMTDQAGHTAAHVQTDLGQLRRLARTGLAADDHHLVLANGRGDVLAPSRDRQIRIEGQLGDRFLPGLATPDRLPQFVVQPGQPLPLHGFSTARGRLGCPQRAEQTVAVGNHRLRELGFEWVDWDG